MDHSRHENLDPGAEGLDYEVEPGISFAHLFGTLRAYRVVIAVALGAIMLAYAIVALAAYMLSPSERITKQRFRIGFETGNGAYPNGARFSPTDVIAAPILLIVYQKNDLSRYLPFDRFAGSLFILESNAAYESLSVEYQARLSDPKLTAVDRDRILKEFQEKQAGLSKNEYSLNFLWQGRTSPMPEDLVRKTLADVLTQWATYAVNDQNVLTYRVGVLTPKILEPAPLERNEPFVAATVLRSKILKVLENIDKLDDLPSAELVRTSDGSNYSFGELKLRLEDLLRFRVEPLVPLIRSQGLLHDPASVTRFVQSQLAYDERQLESQRQRASNLRDSLLVYSTSDRAQSPETPRIRTGQTEPGENVATQLDASFLDRLVSFASRTDDRPYRQRLVDLYREAAIAAIPLSQSVNYERESLAAITGVRAAGSSAQIADVQTEIDGIRTEVATLIVKMDELHRRISEHLNPATHLYTVIAPPVTQTVIRYPVKRLAGYGLLIFLVSTPIVILLALLHARVRRETMQEHIGAPYSQDRTSEPAV